MVATSTEVALGAFRMDLERIRGNVLFDGPNRGRKLSRFWVLLVLAACIASAGVVGDSTATVIGAMIVAPLMTPIMGAVVSIITSDRANLVRSAALIVAGAGAAILIGFLFGLLVPVDTVSATSSQVAGRINPRLIDLLAAIATGAVGAFAQCREDVADTLPGVAIAISLVPPLTVVGLTLEGGAPGEAWGALLLFLTNVAAILLTGVAVMGLFRVHNQALAGAGTINRRRAITVVIGLVAVLAIPLGIASAAIARDSVRESRIADVAHVWSRAADWTVVSVEREGGATVIVASGPLPAPDADELRTALDRAGYADLDVTLRLIPEERVELPGS